MKPLSTFIFFCCFVINSAQKSVPDSLLLILNKTKELDKKTQWMNDGVKGWLNSRSPKVENYSLSPERYYYLKIKTDGNVITRKVIKE